MSDEAELRDIQRRDAQVFERLLKENGNRLLKAAMCMCRNPQEAEDLVQEAFLTAYKNAHKFQGRSKVYTWIYGIMKNLFRERLKNKRETVDIDKLAELEAESEEEATRFVVIKQAVKQLDQNHSKIIHLRYYEHMNVQQIAEYLKISEGTVKSRLHAAREHLRENFQRSYPKG